VGNIDPFLARNNGQTCKARKGRPRPMIMWACYADDFLVKKQKNNDQIKLKKI